MCAVDRPRRCRCFCPDDSGRANLAIYPDGHTHCFKCGKRETLDAVLARTSHRDLSTIESAISRQPAGQPGPIGDWPQRIDLWRRTLIDGPRRERLDWLLGRGLWLETIARHKLGHTGEWFTIPLPSPLGGYFGVKKRADPRYCDPDRAKYLQLSDPKTVVYRPNPAGTPVVICEGEFDALMLAQLGCDAVTSTGGAGSLAKELAGFWFTRPVYIATDQDAAGEEASEKVGRMFPGAKRLRWPVGNDISEALQAYGSPTTALRGWIEEATTAEEGLSRSV